MGIEVINTLHKDDIVVHIVTDILFSTFNLFSTDSGYYTRLMPLDPLEPIGFPAFRDSVRLYCPAGELWA